MMRLLAAALVLFSALARAGATPTEIEGGFSQEKLSGGRADWKSRYLEAAHKIGERQTVYGGIRETERFGLRDSELSAGYYHPLTASITGLLEGTYSDQHNVLPRYSVGGQLAWQAGNGWVVSGGLRHSEYTATGTDLALLGLERYWSAFRAGYTLYLGKPEGASSASAHRLTFSYYYGDGSSVTLGGTRGREAENVGPPLGVASTDVRSVGILGRHWFAPQWAFTYELLAHEQGTLYRRNGFRLGLRHRF